MGSFLFGFDYILTYRLDFWNHTSAALSLSFLTTVLLSPGPSYLPSKLSTTHLGFGKDGERSPVVAPRPGTGSWICQFVLDSVCSQELQWGHSSQLTCHPIVNWIISLLCCSCWWPTMDKNNWDFVAACVSWVRGKALHHAPVGLLQPLPVLGGPLEWLCSP